MTDSHFTNLQLESPYELTNSGLGSGAYVTLRNTETPKQPGETEARHVLFEFRWSPRRVIIKRRITGSRAAHDAELTPSPAVLPGIGWREWWLRTE